MQKITLIYPLIDEKQNHQTAKLIAKSRKSLEPLLGDAICREKILGQGVHQDRVIAVEADNKIVGFLCLSNNRKDFTKLSFRIFKNEFGFFNGVLKFYLYKALMKCLTPSKFYISAFWIQRKYRNMGLGKQLIEKAKDISIKNQKTLWADVQNSKAEKFYTTTGFRKYSGFHFSALLPKYLGYQRFFWDGY